MKRPPREEGTWDQRDCWSEIAAGHRSVVAIDDSRRDTMAADAEFRAAITIPAGKQECLGWLYQLLDDLECRTSGAVRSFHMRELMAPNRREYHAISDRDRLDYLSEFVALFRSYDLKIVTDEVNFETAAIRETKITRLPPVTRPEELVHTVAWHAEMEVLWFAADRLCPPGFPVSAWLAAGVGRKAGGFYRRYLTVPDRPPILSVPRSLDPPAIFIESAKEFEPLMLADFGAWSVNRLKAVVVAGDPESMTPRARGVARALLPLVSQIAQVWPDRALQVLERV